MRPINGGSCHKIILEAAKLPDIRFHDLRHSCATLLIALGIHPRVIMEILRHTQISTTMNIYGHAIPEQNRDALGELIMPATLGIPRRSDDDEDELGIVLEVKKR